MQLARATPPTGGSSTTKNDIALVQEEPKDNVLAIGGGTTRGSRHVESTMALAKVASGYFSTSKAKLIPTGDGKKFNGLKSANSRGTAIKDQDNAKMGRPGYNYSDYFVVGSWPYDLRKLGYRKVNITSAAKIEYWVLCEAGGHHVFSNDLKIGHHKGQHSAVVVCDANNTTKTIAHIARMGACWETTYLNKPVRWWFAGCIVSRQQGCQCNLYYTEEDDDIYHHFGDWPQMRAEMTPEMCSEDIMERIMFRLAENEVQTKTPVRKTTNKKKGSTRAIKYTVVKKEKGSTRPTKKAKAPSEDEEEGEEEDEEEEEPKPKKKANKKETSQVFLTAQDMELKVQAAVKEALAKKVEKPSPKMTRREYEAQIAAEEKKMSKKKVKKLALVPDDSDDDDEEDDEEDDSSEDDSEDDSPMKRKKHTKNVAKKARKGQKVDKGKKKKRRQYSDYDDEDGREEMPRRRKGRKNDDEDEIDRAVAMRLAKEREVERRLQEKLDRDRKRDRDRDRDRYDDRDRDRDYDRDRDRGRPGQPWRGPGWTDYSFTRY
jgi:hypothetical protein